MDVGTRIKKLREQKGITVNKLANLSGVSQSYLRDIELLKKQPTIEYLEYICFGLGITLNDFFNIDNNKSELDEAINKLNDKQRALLIDFLKSL